MGTSSGFIGVFNSVVANMGGGVIAYGAIMGASIIGGVETMLRELGRRLKLNKVHPHKFRRTLATSAIDKGMPIEQVQQLLGHQKIDTTMHYAMVKQQNVKLAHRKFIG
jgi:integrase